MWLHINNKNDDESKKGYRLAWKLFSFPLLPTARIKTCSLILQRRRTGAQWFERNAYKLEDNFTWCQSYKGMEHDTGMENALQSIWWAEQSWKESSPGAPNTWKCVRHETFSHTLQCDCSLWDTHWAREESPHPLTYSISSPISHDPHRRPWTLITSVTIPPSRIRYSKHPCLDSYDPFQPEWFPKILLLVSTF